MQTEQLTARCHALLAVLAIVTAPAAWTAAPDTIVIEGTLETSVGQPMVRVQLADGRRVLTGNPTEMERLLEGAGPVVRSFPAFLDTGAGSFVISRSTAGRFGIEAQPDAVYHEVGVHDEVAMGVSKVYGLAIAGHDPAGGPQEFTIIEREARVLLNRADEAPVWRDLAAGIDVIGMPAIEKIAVEIVPSNGRRRAPGADDPLEQIEAYSELLRPPMVRLHERSARAGRDALVIELEYLDFNRRRHPDNAGPLPELASNPVIRGVTATHGGAAVEGEWLLDTGAATSLISTKHATTLGLLDESGAPARPPDFELTVTGVGGVPRTLPGFVLDNVRVEAEGRRLIDFRGAHVLVRDVSTRLDDGELVTLDGVLGMNLLLPSATGLNKGIPDRIADPPFKRIWVDGRRRRLILERE